MAFLIFLSAKKFILDRRDPAQAAVSLIPFYGFFVAVIIGLVTASNCDLWCCSVVNYRYFIKLKIR